MRVLTALKKAAELWATEGDQEGKGKARESMMTVNVLMKRLAGTIDQVNFLKLDEYLSKSKIGRKVRARCAAPTVRLIADDNSCLDRRVC